MKRFISLCVALLAVLAVWPGSVRAAPTEISFWTFINIESSDPRSAALKSVVDSFNSSQDAYKVAVQSINWARLDNAVIQATAAGQGPDVLNVYSQLLPRHMAAGTLKSLNPYFSKLSAAEQDDFVMPLKYLKTGSDLMALPWESRVWLMYYRKDLLENAGLGMPTTMDELAKAAAAVSNDQVMGFAVGASEAQNGVGTYETFLPLLWSAGGDMTDESGKATFNSDAGVKVASYFRDLVKNNGMKASVTGMSADDMLSGIKAGTIAIEINGSHRVASARNAAATGDNLGVGPIPSWTPGGKSIPSVAGQTLTIGANSKNPDGAWTFIQHYLSAESQAAFAQAGVLPSRLSSLDSGFFKDDPLGREMSEWATYGAQGRLNRAPSDVSKMSQELARAVQKIILKGTDPKKALDEAATIYDAQHKE